MARFFAGLLKWAGQMPAPLDEEPILEELFSAERLEQYATELAASHHVSVKTKHVRLLLPRLEENRRQLVAAYRALIAALRNERSISPAAEWLVDNFHIVEDQLREIRKDLPRRYYDELPKLRDGEFADYPRVYAISFALIAHTDSRLDADTLKRFIRAYQQTAALSIGEVWAIAITLRLALVENLRRLAARVVVAREEREAADMLADRLLEVAARQPDALPATLDAVLRKRAPIGRVFIVQLVQRLRDQDPAMFPAVDWLDKQLAQQQTTAEQIVQLEHQRQAAAQVSVGNIITSMRLLSALDWREFFESVSLVDPLLAEDPAGAYALMDFATRDKYRHVVERISRRTRATEQAVARRAVELAAQAQSFSAAERRAHVGYYLIDDGLAELEKSFAYRPHLRERVYRTALGHPSTIYFGLLAVLTTLVAALLVFYTSRFDISAYTLVGLALLSIIPASDLIVSVLNWDLTSLLNPRVLPKMDFSEGVPDEARTMVVIPTIFSSEEAVQELLEKLEVHYLSNQDARVFFALLGDFADAPIEETPEDATLLDTAREGIAEMNARYNGDEQVARFHLFHRRRQWNPREGKWMGWERKRGKLHEFNRLLRGARDTSYIMQTIAPAFLARVKYVITLDSDTQLPRDAARKLIGTIAHPLNRPCYDERTGRVIEGYGILQPRISISLTSSARSRFAAIFSGNTGVDPYTTAVSDVYQDLFGEGIYTGKGLYEVDAFERALDSRVPENALLSHDLFEGLYARAALVTDIELLDDYPAHYDTYAKRQHRWTRGDWQIARWLLPRVPDAHDEQATRNVLPVSARWKILDNLRRSLVAPTILLLLLFAVCTLPPQVVPVWALFVAVVVCFPIYAHVTVSLLKQPSDVHWTSHLRSIWVDARRNIAQIALLTTFLPHQAYLMTDAIARTIYRLLISQTNLLEWETAAQAEQSSTHDRAAFLRFMWPVEVIVGVTIVLVLLLKPVILLIASPLLVAWALSPFIAYWISRRAPAAAPPLGGMEEHTLRLLARRTWRYFETFVGDDNHWLSPDNYQEDPRPVIAHRASPTNVGLLLLSTVAAHDFGYVSTLQLVERLELTFATLKGLPKFRGHFFNWYDTQTLAPLMPQYVSTVDSGNLAGHLLAVKQACVEIQSSVLFDERVRCGLADTIALMRDEAPHTTERRGHTEAVTIKQLHTEIEACAQLAASSTAPETLTAWHMLLRSLTGHIAVIEDIVNAFSQEHGAENFAELRFWAGTLMQQTRAHLRDLDTLTHWAASLVAHLSPVIQRAFDGAATQWEEIAASLDSIPALSQIPEVCDDALTKIAALRTEIERRSPRTLDHDAALNGLSVLTSAIEEATQKTQAVLVRYARLAGQCDEMVEAMDFRFLFDEERKVFAIGYNVADGQRDNSFYDLLASESRLTSFVAIAKGDVPQEHWFRLGRQLTEADGSRALISWTATMFEYLMPLLVMRDYRVTLLSETYRAVVGRQIEYGAERGVPWGISESAYNARDLQFNYQYGPFGVPGLGLKRGLADDLVIAPYATMLSVMIEPRAALDNLRRLTREGALARYGLYEAIDYTPERLPQNQKRAIIRAFMTHHQGMSLVALDNLLHHEIMQRRFHAEPLVQATEMLLQERIPRIANIATPRAEEVLSSFVMRVQTTPVTRLYDAANLPTPRTQLLSNGAYSVMVTTAGAGYSACAGLAVTRWREDATRDNWGSFCYLRDVRSGAVWSAGYQPTGRTSQGYEVSFAEDKVDLRRRDGGLLTHTEIIVSPEDNAEVRRISITNYSAREREIEITSYAEVVLAPVAADAAHPAFSNLFIETEFIAAENALLARRRQRSQKDEPVWGVHVVATPDVTVGAVQYETDRGRFVGRGHTTVDPVAIMEDRPLSNTVGAVLDPVFSLRQRVKIQPNETARVSFATAVAHSREEALRLADKYHDPNTFEREAALAWTKSQVEMRHLNLDAEGAHLFQRLAGRVLYSDPSLRPRSHVLALNTKTQAGLWPYGISGDLPIVIVRIGAAEDLQMVREILRGHEYLRLKGLAIDLVILNDHPPSYAQSLQDDLQTLIRTSGSQALVDKPGGVFLRRTDIMPEADKILLHAVARVVIVTDRGTLEEQLIRRPLETERPAPFVPRQPAQTYPQAPVTMPELSFFNGLGGFSHAGREYVTVLNEGQWTPAPWLNVIANAKDFGFQVSETGAGYTWSVNSRENRLTPWSNDAVSDTIGEAIYLRDEDTGEVWTPTPLPIREAEAYIVRHGQGYTVFEHASHGISQELLMFVPLDASVKISLLRLRNQTDRKRRISITSYAEWVLGVERGPSAPHIITEIDAETGAIIARNPYNNEFAGRVAFAALSERQGRSVTCDRKEFLGRNSPHARPAALRRTKLSGRAGAGLDACAGVQAIIELEPNEAREIVVLLGEAETIEEARTIVSRYRQSAAVNEAFDHVVAYWDGLLGTVEIATPDAAMNTIVNRWLPYQALACRVWSRSAFYQSGGAYGFRDQLQDVMALVYARPHIVREQITRAAAHQFVEGDVQHWWHPPTGRGVRTRFSDDLLWLPYVTSFYVNATGDTSVLDEVVPFLEAPLLAADQDESYTQPIVSTETASVYEHCIRAIDRSLTVGAHGLPLMGSGDWNDGMNHVGNKGQGESVWVGWFLYTTLNGFAPFCEKCGDATRGREFLQHADKLKRALEEHAWDGDWYRRAYFDDGTPLGSAQNEECKIDSIAQSWGVISGAADPQRALRAMTAVEEYLIRRGDGLVILFTPPFDHSALDPGYIKGYVPGVRENGGQYTHAALWTLIAYAKLGDGDRAGELFALLNPINHASTRAGLHRYKVEPYVAAGDVYAVPPHTGRGGWTWYTGSASWMYRAALESILGFQLCADHLEINPCIPQDWREYTINYRHGSTIYQIQIENPQGVCRGILAVEVNGAPQEEAKIALIDDGKPHRVRIVLGDKTLAQDKT